MGGRGNSASASISPSRKCIRWMESRARKFPQSKSHYCIAALAYISTCRRLFSSISLPPQLYYTAENKYLYVRCNKFLSALLELFPLALLNYVLPSPFLSQLCKIPAQCPFMTLLGKRHGGPAPKLIWDAGGGVARGFIVSIAQKKKVNILVKYTVRGISRSCEQT